MKIAIAQTDSWGAVKQNVEAAASLVEGAAATGARLLLLSELFLTGYDLGSFEDENNYARVGDGALIAELGPLIDACKLHRIEVLLGAPCIVQGAKKNVLLQITPDGRVRIVYEKIHLFDDEKRYFQAGGQQVILSREGVRIGLGICYDAGFPEFVRSYAMQDVDIVLFSSAFAEGPEKQRYNIYHPARALENGIYVGVSNSLGSHGERSFFGSSRIYDPSGSLIEDAGCESGIILVDVLRTARKELALSYLEDLQVDENMTIREM